MYFCIHYMNSDRDYHILDDWFQYKNESILNRITVCNQKIPIHFGRDLWFHGLDRELSQLFILYSFNPLILD